jgi:hypothetical protein
VNQLTKVEHIFCIFQMLVYIYPQPLGHLRMITESKERMMSLVKTFKAGLMGMAFLSVVVLSIAWANHSLNQSAFEKTPASIIQ